MRHSDSCKRQAQKSNRRTGIRNGVRFAPVVVPLPTSSTGTLSLFPLSSFSSFFSSTLVLYCFDLLGFSFIFLFFLVVWFACVLQVRPIETSAQRDTLLQLSFYFVTTFWGVALSGFKRTHFLCQPSVKTAISNHKRLIPR